MGGVTWYLARAGARRRVRSALALVLLVGLTGAVVLAAWAGARRTATTYDRLQESVHQADLTVATEGDPGSFDPTIAVDGPGVVRAGIANGYPMAELTDDGRVDLTSQSALIAPRDETAFYDLNRPVMVEGRIPDPDAPDEIVVPEALREHGYGVGRTVDVCFVDYGKAIAFGEGVLEGTASEAVQRDFADSVCARRTLHVVGITGPGPDEVVLREDTESESFPVGSPALTRDPGVTPLFSFVLVDLEDGADPAPYIDSVLDRTAPDAGVSVTSSALRTTSVDRALEPYVRALTLFAAAVALAGLGVAGPAAARWAGVDATDRSTLRAVGVRSGRLRVASTIRGAALGLVAGGLAVVVAAAASDRFPRGVGARIEPDPGRRVDGVALGLGFLAIVAAGALFGALAPTRERVRLRQPSRVSEVMQALGIGPSRVAGVRSALAGDGRGAGIVPTVAGVTLALTAVIAALTYQEGLDRLLAEPVRYGWRWDEVIDAGDEAITPELVATVAADPHVDGVSVGYRSLLVRDGEAVQLFAFDRTTGDAFPAILDGRAPDGADEIALGGQTLARLDASIGDELEFRGPQGEVVALRVVGQTLLPLSSFSADLSVGEGGLVSTELVEQFGVNEPGLALVDLAEDAPAGTLQRLLGGGAKGLNGLGASGPLLTADLRSYQAVRHTPLLLATALALLGLGVLAHTVATSVRRRRLELAVLRSLGFVGRDLRASVRWSVLTLVVACVVVSTPLGIAMGRLLWSTFAEGLGVDSGPVTPIGPIVAVDVLAIAAGVLFALIPARQATRLRVGEVLRAE
ncbi:MAG: ABC transporter permease [Acidimicrobiales bacterium]